MPIHSPGAGGQTSWRPMTQSSPSAATLMAPTDAGAASPTAPTPLALSAIFFRHSVPLCPYLPQ
eukprot:4866920-Heterocapsa_arctica.AAC.1